MDKKQDALDRALIFAAQEGQTNIVEALLEAGANIHFGKDQPLMCAAKNGHTETVKLLLGAGADLHGAAALGIAVQGGHVETIRVLYEIGNHKSAPRGPAQPQRPSP